MPDVREIAPGESHRTARALLELRPHLVSADALAARINELRASGYRLLGSFEAGDGDAAAAAGSG